LQSIKKETSPKVNATSAQNDVVNGAVESLKEKSQTPSKSEKVISLKDDDDDDDDLPDLSRPKPVTPSRDVTSPPKVQLSTGLEEQNLAPAKASKSRSKSPQEPVAFAAAVNETTHKAAAGEILSTRTENVAQSTASSTPTDDSNLAPVKTSKSRSKSPKSPAVENHEEIISNTSVKIEVPPKALETVATEQPEPLQNDSGEKVATKPSKKKKRTEADDETAPENKNVLEVIDLSNETIRIVVTPPKATKKKPSREVESSLTPSVLSEDVRSSTDGDASIDTLTPRISKKSSPKLETDVVSNGRPAPETAVTSDVDNVGSTTPTTKKKSRRVEEDSAKPNDDVVIQAVSIKEPVFEAKPDDDTATTTVVAEKSKRKKSSKSATPTLESETAEQNTGEGTPVKVISVVAGEVKENNSVEDVTIVLKQETEAPEATQRTPAVKKSKRDKSVEDLTELPAPVVGEYVESALVVPKVLEHAIQAERVDAVAVSEVEDIPSNDITIVQAVSDAAVPPADEHLAGNKFHDKVDKQPTYDSSVSH